MRPKKKPRSEHEVGVIAKTPQINIDTRGGGSSKNPACEGKRKCGSRRRGQSMGARLKELVAQGKLMRVFALGQLCYPKLVEIVGFFGGFDAVWLDQEHSGLSMEQIENCARA